MENRARRGVSIDPDPLAGLDQVQIAGSLVSPRASNPIQPRYVTVMALSNAERQRRHRERLKAGQPPPRVRYQRPKDKRSKARRWSEAVQELVELQAEYQAWLDSLPENLRSSAVAEQLETICDMDIESLQEVEPPRGFGRD